MHEQQKDKVCLAAESLKGHSILQLPMSPEDVYLQDGCWHALWDGAVDHSEAPFHGSVKLLLAPLLGQEDPRCSAEAVAKLSSAWLRAHRGVNDAEQQWQAKGRELGCTMCDMHGASRKSPNRRGQLSAVKIFVVVKAPGAKTERSTKTWEWEDRKKKREDLGAPLRCAFFSHYVKINVSYICLDVFLYHMG